MCNRKGFTLIELLVVVFLFAASQGLAAWFHNCDRRNTAKELKLRSEQRVLFAQTVGYLV